MVDATDGTVLKGALLLGLAALAAPAAAQRPTENGGERAVVVISSNAAWEAARDAGFMFRPVVRGTG